MKIQRSKDAGNRIYYWTAIDVDSKLFLGVYKSDSRTGIYTISDLRYILRFCTNKPLFIGDKVQYYICALQRLGLEYKHS